MGVPAGRSGAGFTLILREALGAGPVSAAITNAGIEETQAERLN